MSNHNGPECAAPEHLRCEALAHGNPSYHWRWAAKDRRCSKRAYSFRNGVLVCASHAKAKRDPAKYEQ